MCYIPVSIPHSTSVSSVLPFAIFPVKEIARQDDWIHSHFQSLEWLCIILGRFPFTQKFRNFRFGGKWNTFRRFVPMEQLFTNRKFHFCYHRNFRVFFVNGKRPWSNLSEEKWGGVESVPKFRYWVKSVRRLGGSLMHCWIALQLPNKHKKRIHS